MSTTLASTRPRTFATKAGDDQSRKGVRFSCSRGLQGWTQKNCGVVRVAPKARHGTVYVGERCTTRALRRTAPRSDFAAIARLCSAQLEWGYRRPRNRGPSQVLPVLFASQTSRRGFLGGPLWLADKENQVRKVTQAPSTALRSCSPGSTYWGALIASGRLGRGMSGLFR